MKIIMIVLFLCALLIMPHYQTYADVIEKYACVKKNNGQFRLVDDPSDCNPSEKNEYSIELEVKEDGDLETEMCWTNMNDAGCTLQLSVMSAGRLVSFFGSEVCDSGEEKHIYGSGSVDDTEKLNIGLTFTTDGSHEGMVFVMDLGATEFDLCTPNSDPCEVVYSAEDCDETE